VHFLLTILNAIVAITDGVRVILTVIVEHDVAKSLKYFQVTQYYTATGGDSCVCSFVVNHTGLYLPNPTASFYIKNL